MMSTASAARVRKLLALAASARMIGSPHEAHAAALAAQRIADAAGVDILPLADELGADLECLVPWTEETPTMARFYGRPVATVLCDDGSTMLVLEDEEHGIIIERRAGEAGDYRLLSRGFWRDCEPTEAVLFARAAWGG